MSGSDKGGSRRGRLIAGVALTAMTLGFAGSAWAQTPPDPAALEARIKQLEGELGALAQEVKELKAAQAVQARAQAQAQSQSTPVRVARDDSKAPPAADARPARADPNAANVTIAGGKPLISSPDGRFTFTPRAILQVDAGVYSQASAGPLATDFRRGSLGDASQASHARDLSDGANFRRARIGFGGKLFGDFDYSAIVDFGGAGNAGGSAIQEIYLQYSGLQGLRLRVGAFAPPTGLEDATPNTASLFEERASIAEIVRGIGGGDARLGGAVYAGGSRWSGSLAWTGNTAGTSNNGAQSAIVARAAFTPFKSDDGVAHLGVNTTYVITPGDNGPDVTSGRYALRLRDRPELRIDGTQLIDIGNIDARHLTSAGLELGAQWKSLYLAGEYEGITIERRGSALSDPRFTGWYVQGSWIATGQRRRYNQANGGFDAPLVASPFDLKQGTWGVLELAGRYSVTDLNYHSGAPGSVPVADAVRGGDQKVWSVGANWYLNNVLKLAVQYQDIDIDRLSPGAGAFGAGALTPPAGAQVGQSLRAFAVRAQIAF
jgi:phosphate-selective porin OprO/OprP